MCKRTLSLFLTTVVAAACLAKPPHAIGARGTSAPKAEWTVMLYMNGDNDLDRFALADFEEMAKVSYDPRVNVVVQLDRIGGTNTDESWGETRRFLMREKLTPTRSNSLPGFSEESNMGDPAALASFVTWSRANFPAERYMLVIWSHGDGWRRMIREGPAGEPAAARTRAGAEVDELLMRGQLTDSKLASMNLLQTSLETQYRTISEDETNGFDKLYVREIQDALEGVFRGGGGLEVIGFDACLMQMIETAYAMRRVAKVMVGSEELEPLPGWRYDDWLQALSDAPSMGGDAVSRAVVESYRRNYEQVKTNTTLSAVRLSGGNIERLAAAVSALARELIADLEAELPRITQARDSSYPFAPRRGYHGIDLHRFCSQLSTAGVNAQLRARAQEVAALVESMVVSNYAGKARRAEFGSAGLAIYFPANNAVYRKDKYNSAYTDENEFQAVQFVREHLWDDFLHAYFKRV